MLKIFAFLQNFLAEPLRRDQGVTAVEYAILITIVGLSLIITLGFFCHPARHLLLRLHHKTLGPRAAGRLAQPSRLARPRTASVTQCLYSQDVSDVRVPFACVPSTGQIGGRR